MAMDQRSTVAAYVEAVSCFKCLELVSMKSQANEHQIPNILLHLQVCLNKVELIIPLETHNVFYLEILIKLKNQLMKHIGLINEKKNSFHLTPYNSTPSIHDGTARSSDFSNSFLKFAKLASVTQSEAATDMDSITENTKVVPKSKGFEDIAGLHAIKKLLKSLLILPQLQPQLYNDQMMCNTFLLFGPPGTGKTMLVHAIAAETKYPLYSVTSSDILSKYVGQTEKMIKALFNRIRRDPSPSILFIDEIDGMCRKRGGEEDHSRRLKTEFLCQMSDTTPHSIIICATNAPWDLDSAFLRRFHKQIYVPLPSPEDRFEFFKRCFRDNPFLWNDEQSWTAVLSATEGFSSSDLANLVRHARSIPITELQDIRFWRTNEGLYEPINEPFSGQDHFGEWIIRDVTELPPGTVKGREMTVGDVIAGLHVVKKTVRAEDVEKFEDYLKQ